jgi:DNA-binding HxlR family transcriptional regulator
MRSGFGQFCPVAVACEVFATRWTPLILRELFAGAEQFNEIHRGVPLISRPLLARRLRELEAAGVITIEPIQSGRGNRYRVTESGREFHPIIEAHGDWGQRWTVRADRDNLDPGFLMWHLRRRIAMDKLPPRQIVVCIKFSGAAPSYRGPRTFWLVLERSQVDLCVDDPGFETDLYVDADMATIAQVWLGDLPFEAAQRAGKIRLSGPRALEKAFPGWLLLSHFAPVPRPHPLVDP